MHSILTDIGADFSVVLALFAFGSFNLALILAGFAKEARLSSAAQKPFSGLEDSFRAIREVARNGSIVRRDASLSLVAARQALAEGSVVRGYEAAKLANQLAPSLVPAAMLAADAYVADGSPQRAVETLVGAWAVNPHPDLAAAFAAIEPDESPEARRERFKMLTRAAPDHPESRMLTAELALADKDFAAAREALGQLFETSPTTRSLALIAAIERGQGAPDSVVRGRLAAALGASRGPQWTCGNCHHVHAGWVAVCENCGAFDTVDWRASSGHQDTSSVLLPLIIGPELHDTIVQLMSSDGTDLDVSAAERAKASPLASS